MLATWEIADVECAYAHGFGTRMVGRLCLVDLLARYKDLIANLGWKCFIFLPVLVKGRMLHSDAS